MDVMSDRGDTVRLMANVRAVRALVVPAGQSAAYVQEVSPDLETIQGFIGGDMEAVSVGSQAIMYVNENGKYEGLAVNSCANRLLGVCGTPLELPDDYIVGDAIVFGVFGPGGTNDGNDHDIPDSLFELAARAGVPVLPTTPTRT